MCCHADACLGGFVLPFATRLGYPVPAWDFSLPGVTSMSLDSHKFGMAHKGTSVVLYRSKAIRRHQYTRITDWSGGLYISPGVNASCTLLYELRQPKSAARPSGATSTRASLTGAAAFTSYLVSAPVVLLSSTACIHSHLAVLLDMMRTTMKTVISMRDSAWARQEAVSAMRLC